MKYQKLLGLVLLSISLVACGGSSFDGAASSSASLPASSVSASVSSSVSSGGSSQVSSSSSADNSFVSVSLQSEINRVQPMTGIVFWSTNTSALNTLGNDVQLEFSYLVYRDVVTTLGTYDWHSVDAKLEQAAARGHQMILRFYDTYPGKTQTSIPGDLPGSLGQVEAKSTFIPDWSSAELQVFMLEFFTAFAERYDDDPRLAFLQVGFGSYAEYHLYDGNPSLGQNFPSKSFQALFLDHIANEFAYTPWSLSVDAASANYSPFAASADLRGLSFGLFDDSFMHENHSRNDSEYNRASWLFFGDNRYQSSPAGGEFSYYTSYDQQHVLDPEGPHGRSFEDFASQYRITYVIGDGQLNYQSKERIKAASLATGYAFRVTKLESNGTRVRIGIRNEGIAPLYYDAYPSLNGQRATQTLKGLLPNTTLDIDMTIDEHNPLDLTLMIESDRLVAGQVIQF